MTHDELITISTQELEKLPADEREIIVRHFGTGDPAELAARLADESEELWSPDESQVDAKDWPSAHLTLLLGLHRDNQRSMLQAQRRKVAQELVDALAPERRALYCWHLHTTRRRRVIALTVAAAVQALDEGLVQEDTSFQEAVRQVVAHGIESQIDEIEVAYFGEQDAEALSPPATVEGDRMPAPPGVHASAPAGKNGHEPPAMSTRRDETSAPKPSMHRYAGAGWPPTAMAGDDRTRRSAAQRPAGGRVDWDAIAAETERRVTAKESELVVTMDRLTRIYSGGRLAGRRVRPGTIVVERVIGTPEFPSLVLPNLANIADGFDVGAAVAIVGLMPLEVALAGWVAPGGKSTPEGDRLTAALEASGAAYSAGRASEGEFEATRDALWREAERAGVAVEIAWRLHTKWGGPPPREPAVATALPPVAVRAMPQLRYLLQLHLRQIPTDAHASVISRWIRPPTDHLEVGEGAWQRVLDLLLDHSTCSQCPFVLGSNLDCETCRTWVLSLKRPGAPWTAERIGAALYNCDEPAVATAAVEALAQSTQAPLTAAFFRDFADNFAVRLAKHVKRPEDMDPGYRDHCRKAVEWLLPQPDFPLPDYPPSKGAPRSVASADILMRAAPMSAGWRC